MACCLFLGAPIWAVEGGTAGACRLLWMCYAARGPSGWTTELRKENETCPECLNGSFFSKKYRKVGLYILKVPHCGLGQNILKDEVTEVKMKSLHYVGLTAICHHWVKYICVQASKAQKSSWDDGFELLSLSAFKFQILKANPFVGQGYPATWVEFHLQLWSVTARYQHLMNSVFVRERVGVCVCGQHQLTEKLIICILNE